MEDRSFIPSSSVFKTFVFLSFRSKTSTIVLELLQPLTVMKSLTSLHFNVDTLRFKSTEYLNLVNHFLFNRPLIESRGFLNLLTNSVSILTAVSNP